MTRKKLILAVVGIVVLTSGILLAMGRTPWCQCGTIKFWSSDINGPENSQQLADPYSFTHVLHGLGFYGLFHIIAPQAAIATRILTAVAVESGWEILENTNFTIDRYRAATVSNGYYGDSVINSVSDILMMLIGFHFARKLRVRLSVLIFILIELGLALLIRDGLLINIVMLLYPLATLKNWQLGI